MKTFPIAPGILLVFILSVRLGAASGPSDVAKYCCLQFSHKTLPWKRVQTYEFTRNSCSLRAVIFTTKKGRKVCADPKEKWVQKYISSLRAQQRP
ncbi:C-C motif chemokine ligand 26 [Rhinolophus ferrumequinum]|uniref:C-C motif chemokine n=1 Tax=Rhinolophus ferrumequinum TaxID=59479 RepID=A0A671EHG0_RHIFE|nr:C-C motif chemokine 26 [Rhinolophus ferrumequinum]KAF6356683.1 C-C motif chemokine ligand 26 [Rhinolophus ferrumequinum]